MNYLKFGIHGSGVGGNYTGLGDYIAAMCDSGKPAVVFAVDNSGPAEAVQILAREFDVIGFRMTGRAGETLDLLDYHSDPIAFAQQRFERTAVHWPTELDATRVWTTPCNEPSKELSEADWLAAFTLEYARLSVEHNRRLAAYGWSMGTPEPWFWQLPDTLAFLRLCAQHPNLLAVNLHEYSGTGNLQDGTPWLIGRFAALHDACDAAGIARPNIIVGEFGWSEREIIISQGTFASQLAWAQELYSHPNILGAAIWTLGQWHGSVANDLAGYLPTLTALALAYQGDEPPPPPPPSGCRGAPREDYRRTVHVIPADTPEETATAIFRQAWREGRQTVGGSYDDAGIGDLDHRTAVLHGIPPASQQLYRDWYTSHYPGVHVQFHELPGTAVPALPAPNISQRDPRWASAVLGQNTGHSATIGNWGCLLVAYTSMAQFMALAGDDPAQMNSRMVAAGAFSAQYILPAALRTAFPDSVTYHGYKQRSDATMSTTIAAYLADGIPVPARVDFNPTTPQWEQHWVLLVGRDGDDWLMMDPWYGDVKRVSERYGVAGQDVLEALFYRPKTAPPPPLGTAGIGLHAGADSGDLSEAEFAEFRAARPDVIKVLSSHSAPAIGRLAAENPTAVFIVRAFLHFGGRSVTPSQFFEWTISDVQRSISAIGAGRTALVELHNEPNLFDEGLGASWANGTSFGDWLVAVAGMYRAHLPASVRLMFPGLSPGGDIPQVRQGHTSFLQQATRGIDACNDFGAHVYWAHNYPMAQALADLDNMIPFRRNKPVWVTEASNNRGGATPGQKAQQYIEFWQALRLRQPVQGVTYFVASASNPLWGWGAGGHCELWIDNGVRLGIGAAVGAR